MISLKTHMLILGLGRSGLAAARLLLQEGRNVTVVDQGCPAEADGLRAIGAEVVTGCETLPEGMFDLVVVSPGVAIDSLWMKQVRERNLAYVSELELGWSRCSGKTLAITGSLGKSTVATWCSQALQGAGFSVALAGNIGLPVSEQAAIDPDVDFLVLEVSSFQCETLDAFRPDVGLFLNLFPNHLDRHLSMDSYLRAKLRMFGRMEKGDCAIIQSGWRHAFEKYGCGAGSLVEFGVNYSLPWCYENGEVIRDHRNFVSLKGTHFENKVLGVNATGAVAALEALGLTPDIIEQSARSFHSLAHRMEFVTTIGDVDFINDSKSTSLTSMIAAVNMVEGPVHLIAGGKVKETDLAVVAEQLAGQKVSLYLIGESAPTMEVAWADKLDCINSGSLQKAVEQSWSNANAGETILLSPGCASFDQFENFEDRGRQFGQIVQGLRPENIKN